MTALSELRIYLLGTFRVLVNNQPVQQGAWRSRRASALIKLLALAPSHRLPREQVAEELWPNFELDAQLNNLNVATTRARHALASAGAPDRLFLTRDNETLVLAPAGTVWVDVTAFEVGVAEAWRTQDISTGRTAISLYQGDLLPDDLYEEWTLDRRSSLRTQYLAILDRLAQIALKQHAPTDAIEFLQRLVDIEPSNEAAQVDLMQLYERLDQRERALAQYDELIMSLQALDAEPEPKTVELVQEIRARHQKALAERTVKKRVEASRSRPMTALPAPPGELFGREGDIAEIQSKLASARLVTLTGAGGIGKTRLALAVARQMTDAFSDGTVFVDLSSLSDPELVAPAIAQAIEPEAQGGQSSIPALRNALESKQLLLIIDNFEQVAEAAPVITAILERGEQCRMLITSRIPLRIRGEAEYPVPPLALPDSNSVNGERDLLSSPAAALFIQRARDAKPDFAVTENNVTTIAEICYRLDGLPLAIELAAARVKVLSPSTMLSRLNHPLSLLRGGPRDLPPRQQTIQNTIEWSFNLLSPPEQRLLSRLSVFVGSWSLEAAEQIIDPDGELGIDVLDGVSSLVDKSLVAQRTDGEDEMRFVLLEAIREFAAERLGSSFEETRIRDSHASFFVAFAEQSTPHLEGRELSTWLKRLDREDGNLRIALKWLIERRQAGAALRLVTSLRVYWFIRGRQAEGCDEFLTVAAMSESHALAGQRIDALNAAAFFAREYGDYSRAYDVSIAAYAAAESFGDLRRKADALATLGYLAIQEGDYTRAKEILLESLQLNESCENRQGIADTVNLLGLAAYYENNLDDALRLNLESLDQWTQLNDLQAVAWARTWLGKILIRQGAYVEAYQQLEAGLTMASEFDFRWGLSWTLDALAHLAVARGSHELAHRLMAAAEGIREASALRLPPGEAAELVQLQMRLSQMNSDDVQPVRSAAIGRQELESLITSVRTAFTA